MHRKFIIIILLIAIVMTSQFNTVSAAPSLNLTPEEEAWLKEHPVLYYIPDPVYAPIEYLDENNEAHGVALDYLDWIERHYGIQIKIVPVKSWSEVLRKVQIGEADFFTGAQTPEREKHFEFSDPYIFLQNTILVRNDFNGTLTEADLAGLKVGVMRNYAVHEYLKIKHPGLDLIPFDSVEDALKKLSFGAVDALVMDVGQGSFYTTNLGINNLKSAGDVDYSYQLTFVVRREYTPLVSILNKAIQSMPDEAKDAIHSRWISYNKETVLDQRLIYFALVILLVILIILSAILLWNRLLRRQVSIQTTKLQKELNTRIKIQEELLQKNQQISQMNTNLEMSKLELSTLIDQVPYHIFSLDNTEKYVLVNQSFLDFYNLTSEDVLGKTNEEILKSHPLPYLKQVQSDNSEVLEFHKTIVLDDVTLENHLGESHIMRIKKMPYFIWKTNEWGLLGVVLDISDLKHAEQQMEELNEKLEAKVERRTYLLNETNRELELSMYRLQLKQNQLEEANLRLEDSLLTIQETQNQLVESEKLAALGRLVAGVSHEINTPLGIGITAISYLEKECKEIALSLDENKLTRKSMELFLDSMLTSTKLVLTNLKNAAGLVNKFKQIAVDQSTEELREFNLHEYLDSIIQSLSPQLKHTKYTVSLDCPDDIIIMSYPSILTQIITNLVMNSLVHGFDQQEHGDMKIEVTTTDRDMVAIHYWDNGIGISHKHLEKIFEPFFTTKRGKGGVGLGLNIVYNLITATLNGIIEVESQEGKGAHFHIQIPKRLHDSNEIFFNDTNVQEILYHDPKKD